MGQVKVRVLVRGQVKIRVRGQVKLGVLVRGRVKIMVRVQVNVRVLVRGQVKIRVRGQVKVKAKLSSLYVKGRASEKARGWNKYRMSKQLH